MRVQFQQWTAMIGRGRVHRLAAWLALLGFIFSATSPGLSLVTVSGLAVDGPLGVFICHAQGSGQMAPLDGQAPNGKDCCLICQVAQMANGTVSPLHFTLPTESAIGIRQPLAAQSVAGSDFAFDNQARAPPLG